MIGEADSEPDFEEVTIIHDSNVEASGPSSSSSSAVPPSSGDSAPVAPLEAEEVVELKPRHPGMFAKLGEQVVARGLSVIPSVEGLYGKACNIIRAAIFC